MRDHPAPGSSTAPPPAPHAADADARRARRDRRICLALLLLLLLAMAAYAPTAARRGVRSDFGRYYAAGCRAARAGEIYATQGNLEFKYLPVVSQLTSLLARPCEWLAARLHARTTTSRRWLRSGSPPGPEAPTEEGMLLGAYAWYALLCASYFAFLLLSVSLLRPATWSRRLLLGVAGFIFCARFLYMNLRLGQINLPAIFWALLGCWLLQRRRETAGGAAVALAAALKNIPVGLVLWFLRRRWWRALLAFMGAALLLVLVAPMLTWGARGGTAKVAALLRRRHHLVTDLSRTQAAGQSLSSLCNRFLTRVNATTVRRDRPLYVNLADNPRAAKVAALLLVAAAILAAMLAIRGDPGSPRLRFGLETGLMFLLLLVGSPESRQAHFISSMVAAMALLEYALTYRCLRVVAPVLAFAFACMSLTSAGIWGHGEAYYQLNAHGVVMAGCLALFACSCWALWRLPPSPGGAQKAPGSAVAEAGP